MGTDKWGDRVEKEKNVEEDSESKGENPRSHCEQIPNLEEEGNIAMEGKADQHSHIDMEEGGLNLIRQSPNKVFMILYPMELIQQVSQTPMRQVSLVRVDKMLQNQNYKN
ncbi:hypothetical protein HAX54_041560 [Datura stramonium]|uniref:Uncharacterized protein n=1 Tax=Datura stramonium TaxID=4076 RepID=A0ABS8RQ92_DATST|nr:hypothetical protein [Datura stramonium]